MLVLELISARALASKQGRRGTSLDFVFLRLLMAQGPGQYSLNLNTSTESDLNFGPGALAAGADR